MAVTLDPSVVESLIQGTTIDSDLLAVAVADAKTWVENRLEGVCVANDAAKLQVIGHYLAAGMAVRGTQGVSGPLASKKIADTEEKYASAAGSSDVGLSYFQIAAAFDACGIVAKYWLDKLKASAYVGAGYVSAAGGA